MPQNNQKPAQTTRVLEQEMQSSYLDYAMSVIVARALPDVRDGLKPVHRRILYSMWEIGLRANAKFQKAAKVVGEVLGKYHPHGDVAVYDALVRMAQDFSMRYPLVEGQGNFGSLDGDPPAAMRYTEVRLSPMAEEMLFDLEKETVDFAPNYDATRLEPSVLPSKLPNLLLNGSMGIAVGMATNIPPHNLGELVDGLSALILKPDLTIDELMVYIKGPDFPTGGLIYSSNDIKAAYAIGKGPVVMRAKTEIEETKKGQFRIIIQEIPYQVNKAELISKIADLVKEKKLEGISDIRDESNRKEGVRIVIELKSNAYPKKILNRLFELTYLQTTFHLNMLALTDGLVPKVLTLKNVLEQYLEHRRVMVRKRATYDKKKALERVHILEGLKKALDHIDAIIKLIKASQTREEAFKKLIQAYKLTEIQANAILDMRLAQLAGLERKKILDELEELKKLIVRLTALLASKALIDETIKKELLELKNKYQDTRRTEIIDEKIEGFAAADLIPNEQVIVTLTENNYVKRIPTSSYHAQHRGGKGIIGLTTKEEDKVTHLLSTFTHNDIMFFTDKGRVFQSKVFDLPSGSRQSRGQALVNVIQIAPNELVTALISLDPKEETDQKYFFMATKNGVVKKTAKEDFQNVRKSGLIAIRLRSDDSLLFVGLTSGEDEILLVTKEGKSIRFPETDVRSMGRAASGVKGINLKKGDVVISMDVLKKEREAQTDLLVVLENGLGKRTKISEFKVQKRGGTGIKAASVTTKTGQLVKATITEGEKGDIVMVSKSGQVIRLPLKSVKRLGRATQGVRLMRLNAGDLVASSAVVKKEKVEEKIQEPIKEIAPLPKEKKKPEEKKEKKKPAEKVFKLKKIVLTNKKQPTVQPEKSKKKTEDVNYWGKDTIFRRKKIGE